MYKNKDLTPFRASRHLLTIVLVLALGMLVRARVTAAPPSKPASFSFGVISDLHVGAGDNDKRFARVVQALNESNVKFVVITGDLVDSPTDQAVQTAQEIVGRLKMPHYAVLGNHDVGPKNVDEMVKRFGPLLDKTEVDGVQLLFCCTQPLLFYWRRDETGALRYDGGNPPQHPEWKRDDMGLMAWLQQSLDAAKGKPVLLFTHIPLENTWSPEDRTQFLTLLHDRNVKAMFAGHLHEDQLVWEDDFPEYLVPPVAPPLGGTLMLRIYNYDNGRIGYHTQYLRLLPETPPAATHDARQGGK
ncbi:MAG: metallophosphoesterase [Verrucomicrobiota bacterium]